MSYGPNASQEYLKNAVLTATPEQLQLMLYDGAIRFATRGGEAIRAKDREGAFHALERAQRIVLEMGNGINREVNPQLADQMSAIYDFIYRRLIDANVDQDLAALDEALELLRYQRETWTMLMQKLAEGEVPVIAPPPGTAAAAPSPPPSAVPATEDASPSSFEAEG
jgi:flagellar protein FliS